MNLNKTIRGFEIIRFKDRNQEDCSLQQSSAIDLKVKGADKKPGSSMLWLGINGDRMHLDKEQVLLLNKFLKQWLKTGSFEF